MKHIQTPLIAPVPGTQRCIDSFHFGPQDAGKKVYIQSSLHADELPGMLVSWKLKQQLLELEQHGLLLGEVVLVPVANPIGQNQHIMDIHLGRYELENGANFNRNYYDTYSDVRAAIADQLSDDTQHNKQLIRAAMRTALLAQTVTTEYQSHHQALQLLSHDADVMLDLHCDFEAMLHTYSTYYSWPGIEPLARALDSQVNMLANETGGSPFDCSVDMIWQRLQAEFGERIPQGCLGATIELRGQADVNDTYAEKDANAIIQYLHTLDIISGDTMMPEGTAPSSDLAAVETLTTPMGGLLVLHAQPGDWLQAGDLFAEVIDPVSDKVEPIRVSQAGRVYSRTNRRMATAGMLVGNVAGEKVIRSGYLLAP
ncbi:MULTISPECIES: succinylglutamate desuccinylase/aspartoacylase family protein [unclassified Vibrio]|uniref:succinylglutamate desuccinylase/aspartoacylase family protein n=1 Tax=Gammaproteobacteria TaxID=1236 RepID=UPI0010A67B20|nr:MULTISPECIES: succinylglutamate desuccinylase/aspartoacylase family protein [unclassified Vibrio]WGY45402.1 succinylglutamate desuccinylase/aspartoacylase family protein [Vibrio sp. ABG19]